MWPVWRLNSPVGKYRTLAGSPEERISDLRFYFKWVLKPSTFILVEPLLRETSIWSSLITLAIKVSPLGSPPSAPAFSLLLLPSFFVLLAAICFATKEEEKRKGEWLSQILHWPKTILHLGLWIEMEHVRTKEGGVRLEETGCEFRSYGHRKRERRWLI